MQYSDSPQVFFQTHIYSVDKVNGTFATYIAHFLTLIILLYVFFSPTWKKIVHVAVSFYYVKGYS
jgi:hypothetical protein